MCVRVCVCVFQSMIRWPIFARVTCRCSLLTYHYSWVPVHSLFGGTSNARPIIPNSARASRPPRRTCMYPSLVIRHVILAYHDPVPYCQPVDGHMDGSIDSIYIPMHVHIYIPTCIYIYLYHVSHWRDTSFGSGLGCRRREHGADEPVLRGAAVLRRVSGLRCGGRGCRLPRGGGPSCLGCALSWSHGPGS